jgi:ribosomal protein S18 acetylase RimI-like enzyme
MPDRLPHTIESQSGPLGIVVRTAQPHDVPDLMRLKRLLAQNENALHALRATESDWLRDGFGPKPGFTAFVAECIGSSATCSHATDSSIVGMVTCSQRMVTGWNGPVVFLQDLFVETEYRAQGIARALAARVAAFARDIGSPIVELTVRADNPAQQFYLNSGFQQLPECLTFVISGPELEKLADGGAQDLARTA